MPKMSTTNFERNKKANKAKQFAAGAAGLATARRLAERYTY